MGTNLTVINKKGFTLIELLVVIAILAILAVIGATIYNNVQVNARDSRRKADIDSIAKAFEANKTPNTTTYVGLDANQFSQQSIPVDTTTAKYVIKTNTTATPPGVATVWDASSATPTTPTGYTVIADDSGNGAASWTVCARLETGTIYCKSNSQ